MLLAAGFAVFDEEQSERYSDYDDAGRERVVQDFAFTLQRESQRILLILCQVLEDEPTTRIFLEVRDAAVARARACAAPEDPAQ